ncbi:MAG: hypothetical protein NVSMB13_10920 [Mycobacteriales bacterium]
MPATSHSPQRSRRPRLGGWLLAQVGLLAAVAVYTLGYGGPLVPDAGLRQLDLLSLHERVPGVAALDGRPTLVVAAGPTSSRRCTSQVALASNRRGSPAGVDRTYAVLVLVPDVAPAAASVAGLDGVNVDAGGALARALGLRRAATGCSPGYAVVDAAGFVRYRTYDPAWGAHGQEQNLLLRAVR